MSQSNESSPVIQSKTASGVPVTLTGIERYERPTVKVELIHPKLGKMEFESSTFGSMATGPKGPTADGIIGYTQAGKTCVTVPRSDFDKAMGAAHAIGEDAIAALRSGDTKITLRYHDGEYLSGWMATSSRAGELLRELGLAKEVSGWGTHVESSVANALGESFAYPAAVELARPALKARQAKQDAKADERAAKFATARDTGKPVELARWMDECDGSVDDCTWDCVSEYAMPDGSVSRDRCHTH